MKALALLLGAFAVVAAAPPDPDWPCVQRLVPTLGVATFWAGDPAQRPWADNPAIAALAPGIADRTVRIEDALARLQAFLATHPDAEARAELFTALVDLTNRDRGTAIDRLRAVDRRLRALADANGRVTAELSQLPADAPEATRDEVVNRRLLLQREYDALNRTVRFGCEVPVDYEARLGRFARALQG